MSATADTEMEIQGEIIERRSVQHRLLGACLLAIIIGAAISLTPIGRMSGLGAVISGVAALLALLRDPPELINHGRLSWLRYLLVALSACWVIVGAGTLAQSLTVTAFALLPIIACVLFAPALILVAFGPGIARAAGGRIAGLRPSKDAGADE